MKKSSLLVLSTLLVASSALASNTGFKLNYPLVFNTGKSNLNWVSVPLFYFPNGNVATVGAQNSVDLCKDFNDFDPANPKVTNTVRFVTSSDAPSTQNCSVTTKVAFNIVKGEAYGAVPRAANIVINIVGSNDDTFAPNKGGTATYPLTYNVGKSNSNWVSVPYHSTADNSVDLCRQWNTQTGNRINSSVKFVTSSDAPSTQNCSVTTKVAFNVVPGEAYAAVPNTSTAIAWDVY